MIFFYLITLNYEHYEHYYEQYQTVNKKKNVRAKNFLIFDFFDIDYFIYFKVVLISDYL
jgi:hypothetical protein